jgi:DNA-binding SARP family transcriptional activator
MDSPEAPFDGRASAPLKVYLLGRFEVVRGDRPIPADAWRRRRAADLLKVVALAPRRSIERAAVLELLWPGKDRASGANNLHRALFDLRQVVEGRWVDVHRGVLRLRDDAWVDAAAFEAALASGDPGLVEPALALYHGDVVRDDGDPPLVERRRGELRARFAEVALPVARAAVARGELARAVPLLRRVAAARPEAEEPAGLLVRLLAESGRRGDALRAWEACERALLEAGGAGPGPELRELRDAIQRGEVGPPQPRAPWEGARRAAQRLLGAADPPPLRGHAAPLLLLRSAVEQGGGAVVLLGEAGVGKTRLALEGARFAQERGAVVLAGGAADAVAALAPFAEAFGEWARAAGVPDPLAGAEDADAGRLVEAIRAALSAAGSRPAYLIVDDLEAIDEPSAALLHVLAREARALRLVLVATCREDGVRAGTPVQALLAHLDCERLARGVRVQRLELAATLDLAGDVLGAPAGDALGVQLYRLSDGNPFHAAELARTWLELRWLPTGGGPAAAVRERAAQLPPRFRALLDAAAAAGPRFDADLVRLSTGLSGHDAVAALDACLGAGLVATDGPGYRFPHALVREAVHAAIPPDRRAGLHRALAGGVAARSPAAAEALARHLLEAGDAAAARPHLLAAARRATARGALAEALGWYAEALDAAPPPAERAELLAGAAAVELTLGDVAAAIDALEEAARLAPGDDARRRRDQAWALLAAGRPDEAAQRIDGLDAPELRALLEWHAGLRDSPPEPPGGADPLAAARLGLWEHALAGDLAPAALEPRAAGELALAGERRAPAGIALACAARGAIALRAGRRDEAEPALREAVRRAREAREPSVEAFAAERLGELLTRAGRGDEGLAAIGDGLVAAGRAEIRRHRLVRLYAALSRNRLDAGAVYAAEDAIREASAVLARHPGCALCDAAFRPQAVRVALARGRIAEAAREVAQLREIARSRGGRALAAVAQDCRARLLAAEGRLEEAAAEAAAAREVLAGMGWAGEVA